MAGPDDLEAHGEPGMRLPTKRSAAGVLDIVVDGSLLVTLGELATARRAAIVVEEAVDR